MLEITLLWGQRNNLDMPQLDIIWKASQAEISSVVNIPPPEILIYSLLREADNILVGNMLGTPIKSDFT